MEYFRGSNAPEFEEIIAMNGEASISNSKLGCSFGNLQKLAKIAKTSFLKPFSCVGILYLSYHMCGYGPINGYSNYFFENAGAHGIDYATESAVSSIVKFVLSVFAPLILSRVSKKILFVVSGFVSAMSFILGNYAVGTFNETILRVMILIILQLDFVTIISIQLMGALLQLHFIGSHSLILLYLKFALEC